MSVAYISTLNRTFSGPRLPLSTLEVNQNGIVSSFKNSDSPDNPDTFSLIGGTYRITVWTNASMLLQATEVVQAREVMVLYDESTGTVKGNGNPWIFQHRTTPAQQFANSEPDVVKISAAFSFSGLRSFSVRFLNQINGGFPLSFANAGAISGVTAVIGSSMVPDTLLQIKILRT